MTVGYGGVQEFRLPIRWAKLAGPSRGHSGKFHAWTALGGVCRLAKAEKPTKASRERQPVKSCASCAKEVLHG